MGRGVPPEGCQLDSPRKVGQNWHIRARMKKLTWLGDSLANLKVFPAAVQDDIGFALYVAQLGGTYRAVYTVSIGESIYVVHAFQKKSKAGIAIPKTEIELVRQRLKQLRSEVKNAEKTIS